VRNTTNTGVEKRREEQNGDLNRGKSGAGFGIHHPESARDEMKGSVKKDSRYGQDGRGRTPEKLRGLDGRIRSQI